MAKITVLGVLTIGIRGCAMKPLAGSNNSVLLSRSGLRYGLSRELLAISMTEH